MVHPPVCKRALLTNAAPRDTPASDLVDSEFGTDLFRNGTVRQEVSGRAKAVRARLRARGARARPGRFDAAPPLPPAPTHRARSPVAHRPPSRRIGSGST